MTSINLSEIFDALNKTINESELPFDKDLFFNELKINITKDITPLLNEKNIKIIEKKQKPKEIKLSSENSDNLHFSKSITNKDELKKFKVDVLKDYCKVNGIYFKSQPEVKIANFLFLNSIKFTSVNSEFNASSKSESILSKSPHKRLGIIPNRLQ